MNVNLLIWLGYDYREVASGGSCLEFNFSKGANAHFSKTARAFGAQGFRVEGAAHLEETLRHALSLQEPAGVDVLCGDVRLPNLGH
ncbi:MAG: hypothetical protein GX039_06720 [Clostridia bacterium]|nr:hypothetical protein [Clostridia bacterium]